MEGVNPALWAVKEGIPPLASDDTSPESGALWLLSQHRLFLVWLLTTEL